MSHFLPLAFDVDIVVQTASNQVTASVAVEHLQKPEVSAWRDPTFFFFWRVLNRDFENTKLSVT